MTKKQQYFYFILTLVIILLFPTTAAAYKQKLTSNGRLIRWNSNQITLTVVRVDNCSCADGTEIIDSLQRAAETWNEIPSIPTINIIESSNNLEWGVDGVNGVYLVEEWPFSFRALAVTLTTYNDNTGELIDTDVIINGEMPFSTSGQRNRYDLDTVLTHELGHVLGLDESDVHDSTMYPNTRRGETNRRELSNDDIDGVLSLYGNQTFPTSGCNIMIRKSSFNQNIIFLIILLFSKRIFKLFR